jgi:folate-binding Fe-S cluster repair protein YgfZ
MDEARQAIAQPSGGMQYLQQDRAYLLQSRGVIRLRGEQASIALQPLVASSLTDVANRPVLTFVLDEEDYLVADLFVVSHGGDLLLECERSCMTALLELLLPDCEAQDVIAEDVSDQWRVFAELPDQNTFEDGTPYIKYTDPRWHMGCRLLRPVTAPRSSQWGSDIKWAGHAFKLGFLPDAGLLRDVPVNPLEAGLHAIGALDPDRLSPDLREAMMSPGDKIARRILPMRVEPDSKSFPNMTGMPVTASGTEIGTVLGHHGLYGLVLTEIASWRDSLRAGRTLRCAEQTVLITWPSWLAQESRGRGGPVAMAD